MEVWPGVSISATTSIPRCVKFVRVMFGGFEGGEERTAAAYVTISLTSLGWYTSEVEYAPLLASSVKPGTTKGKDWESTTCQWKVLIYGTKVDS
jgi:hypothetical protein